MTKSEEGRARQEAAYAMASNSSKQEHHEEMGTSHSPDYGQQVTVQHHFIHNQAAVKISENKIAGGTQSIRPNTQLAPKVAMPVAASQASGTGLQPETPVNHVPTQPQHEGTTQTVVQTNGKDQSSLSGKTEVATNAAAKEGNKTGNSETGGDGEDDTASKKGGKKKGKTDRSALRKGKWTVEEEEYTSRIIHNFSTGLLTLPEGTTLRSYLAEKLNCDPMRITKKFAGASCLGKRVYHLCDRSQATVTDIQMAKAELARLEHRFRLRVEHGQSGVPLPPRSEVVPSIPTPAAPMYVAPGQHAAPAQVAASWLQSIASHMSTQPPGSIPLAPNQMPQMPNQAGAPAAWPFAQPAPAPQWVAPAPSHAPQVPQQVPNMPPPNPSAVQNATNEAITLAWAQAAASLTPALSQLAAANLQQHQSQLQKAYESQLQAYAQPNQYSQQALQPAPAPQHAPAPPPMPFMVAGSAPQPHVHMPSAPGTMAPPPNVTRPMQGQPFARPSAVPIAPQPVVQQSVPVPTPPPIAARPISVPLTSHPVLQPLVRQRPPQEATPIPPLPLKVTINPQSSNSTVRTASTADSPGRSKEDEAAGSMLMGFLTSLRKGFMEAKSLKDREDREKTVLAGSKVESNETASGTTSYPADSSLEDSDQGASSKDPSSSEESDTNMERPLGPPRKRIKTKIGEFTSKNVAAHTTRMDALHNAEHHHPAPYATQPLGDKDGQ